MYCYYWGFYWKQRIILTRVKTLEASSWRGFGSPCMRRILRMELITMLVSLSTNAIFCVIQTAQRIRDDAGSLPGWLLGLCHIGEVEVEANPWLNGDLNIRLDAAGIIALDFTSDQSVRTSICWLCDALFILLAFLLLCICTGNLLVILWQLRSARLAADAAVVESTQAARRASRQAHLQLEQAFSAILKHTIGMIISFVTGFVAGTTGPSMEYWHSYYMSAGLNAAHLLSNAVLAVLLSGAHRVAKSPQHRPRLQPTYSRQPTKASKETSFGCQLAWDRTVDKLAQRGITLEALLHFYKSLGTPASMPHYTPAVHTTGDVVRQAIIPQSKALRASFADMLAPSERGYPNKMVTHNWGNVFRDLCAAIFADALEEPSFCMVASLLEQDVDVLERMLHKSGRMQQRYWVCAFAVNQHAGICASRPVPEFDTVTGLPHPLCDCGLPKAFNSTGPLTDDGRSIPCEMNKFDDMIRLLAARDLSFSQVIAVDADFGLFGRAWCVAELAEAHRLDMGQHLRLRSRQDLTLHEGELRNLRVESMQASRPEDVEEILAKIPDTRAFNKALRHLVLNGLLVSWISLDSRQQFGEVGRLLRWHAGDQGSGVVWRCWRE